MKGQGCAQHNAWHIVGSQQTDVFLVKIELTFSPGTWDN